MKKRFFYLLPLFILLLLVVCSCKDDNNDPTPPEPSPEITIPSSENLNPVLSQEGGTISISFTTTADWTASLINTRAESWITVTPSSGSKGKNEITITATTNETYDERNATVVLKCGSVSKNIVVTQKQKDALTVTSSKYEVDSKGGNISVEVKANINFEVEVKADWIKQQTEKTRALTTSNLNFTIDPNETGDKREGEIIIKSGELSETIKVYQGFEDFITLTKKDFTIPEEGGNVDIEIKSTLNYEVKMFPDVDWITEIQSRAVSTHTHHYTISPNDTYDPREVKIVFYDPKDENVADTVSIYQMYKGAILVARNEYQIDVKGGELNLTVQTNLEFDVEVSDIWIQQVHPTRALTEYNLSFAISENTEQKDREGTITVKDKNSDKKQVITVKQSYVDPEREALIALYKATNGDNWTNNTNWCSDKPISEWYGIIKNPDGSLLISLNNNNLVGQLPDELMNLKNLTCLGISDNNIEGNIPEWIGELKNLDMLVADNSKLSGSIPKSIGELKKLRTLIIDHNNLEGNIPNEIGKLMELESIVLNNNSLTGTIPEEIGNIKKMRQIILTSNKLKGNIPDNFRNLSNLQYFEVTDNELEGAIPEWFADMSQLKFLALSGNYFNGSIPAKLLQCANWGIWDSDIWIQPQKNGYLEIDPNDLYTSTDFTKDGEIQVLQTHTKGNGIKLVIMGDLFVDTDMGTDGLYETKVREAVEHYFSVEPFRTLRELYDIISIKAVSKHNVLNEECAFSTNTEEGMNPSSDYEKCKQYAQKAIGKDNLDNVSVIMILNCYKEYSHTMFNVNGDGYSLAYCPYGLSNQRYRHLVLHEAAGHGFGLLGDEYQAPHLGEFPFGIDYFEDFHKEGLYMNLDSNPNFNEIGWRHFINDPRYATEGIGIFEGAYHYDTRCYRPTEHSLMRSNGYVDQFNAPSREAIYKRAMKLAYGDSWAYDYEEFVKFDIQGRADWIEAMNKANTRSVKSDSRFKQYKHIPPKIFNYPAVAK